MILIVTDNDVSQITGGLERAAKKFGDWLCTDEVVQFETAKALLVGGNVGQNSQILLIGHRSLSLLAFALYCCLLGHKYSWCPFWHDYKLEGKKGPQFWIYDLFFRFALARSKGHFVVSDYERKLTNAGSPQYLIRLPSAIEANFRFDRSTVSNIRSTDVLFVGRDVPHKQRDYAKRISDKLGLVYNEVIPGKRHISDDELTRIYRDAKIVFIPSKYESYSLVAVEALMSGAVVVAFPNVLVGESLRGYSRYIVSSNDPNEALRIIESEIKNWVPACDHDLSFVLDYFSEDTCKKLFLESFKSL